MKAAVGRVQKRGVDTVQTITPILARAIFAGGEEYVGRYIESLTPAELGDILACGLEVSLYTYAGDYTNPTSKLKALGIPAGVTVWLDAESDPRTELEVAASIESWAFEVNAAGWEAGLYVGEGLPLSAAQLYALPSVHRYCRSCSLVPEPACGWAMLQLGPPDQPFAGITVDFSVLQADYRGRLPTLIAG